MKWKFLIQAIKLAVEILTRLEDAGVLKDKIKHPAVRQHVANATIQTLVNHAREKRVAAASVPAPESRP
jgi:hypothetical protein